LVNKVKMPVSDEYFDLWIMIAQAKDAILKARQREYAQFNINNERRAVLWCIQNNGGQATPVEISYQLFLELHSVTAMLNRMEKEGLIKKCKSNTRSRSIIELTPKGLEIFNQSLHNETDKKIFSILSKKERGQFMTCLWKVRNKAMNELGVPAWRIKFPLDPNKSNNEKITGPETNPD
jgi:DNA-binding MarR family transcriptional regulator